MSNFENRRPAAGRNISIKVPFASKRGIFIMRDPDDSGDPKKAKLATGHAIGILTRDVVTGGPSTIERAGVFPGRIEQPFAVDGECSLEPLPDAYEAEGPDYVLDSGTGAIDANTAIGTKLSVVDGKTRVKQSTDEPMYVLAGKPTPETAGQVRIFCERI